MRSPRFPAAMYVRPKKEEGGEAGEAGEAGEGGGGEARGGGRKGKMEGNHHLPHFA